MLLLCCPRKNSVYDTLETIHTRMLTLELRAQALEEQAQEQKEAASQSVNEQEKARMHLRIALLNVDEAKKKREKVAALTRLYNLIENARETYQLYSMPDLIRASRELQNHEDELNLIQKEEADAIEFPDVPQGAPLSSAQRKMHRSSPLEETVLPLLM